MNRAAAKLQAVAKGIARIYGFEAFPGRKIRRPDFRHAARHECDPGRGEGKRLMYRSSQYNRSGARERRGARLQSPIPCIHAPRRPRGCGPEPEDRGRRIPIAPRSACLAPQRHRRRTPCLAARTPPRRQRSSQARPATAHRRWWANGPRKSGFRAPGPRTRSGRGDSRQGPPVQEGASRISTPASASALATSGNSTS